MPIQYAIMCRDNTTILSEFSEYRGNFEEYARNLLGRVQLNSMMSIELQDTMFHYINADCVTAMCMADKKYNRKQAFAFL